MSDLIIPNHVAIIMDGNGRWAKRRGLPRRLGHKAGCDTLERMVEDCADTGIRILTVYAFSTENWKRSGDEVSALMQLFRFYIPRLKKRVMAKNVRVRVIGDESRFDEDLREGLRDLKESTREHTRMDFVLALNYGSRDEIIRAVRKIGTDAAQGKLLPEEISEELLSSYLDTADIPDPDLVIRTSGEERLSNFLMWQSAYSELYFTDTLWPDFDHETLMEAIKAYNSRERRFGGRKGESDE